MSLANLGQLIRTERDRFVTPNIISAHGGQLIIESAHFRKLTPDVEHVLFYQHGNDIYFPVWFEFRSINNNLLYLFLEYQINSFDIVQQILNSSLEKEEKYRTTIRAVVVHVDQQPDRCMLLPGFIIEDEFRVDIDE